MKLGHDLDEITYQGDKGAHSIYLVTLEGRPVMEIYVHMQAGEISISRAGDESAPLLPTKGIAQHFTKLVEDADGSPVGTIKMIDYKSVYAYVLPRLHILIARLLTPLA